MVSQKLISAKIDDQLLVALDELCSEYGMKRNRMLNALISVGVSQMRGNSSMFNILMALSHVDFD